MQINSAKELTVYKKAYSLAMKIFEISKSFPKEERYALTDQTSEIGKMLGSMIKKPHSFLINQK